MIKKFKPDKLEIGQILPIVSLAMFALIAMAALIIDGAMIMSHRRTAQAAADAAALAGAEWLCPTVYSESDAIAVAEAYVGLNHAEVVEVSISTEIENTIHVETQVESGTFFSGILNQVGLSAGAVAEASCSPLSSGAANLPVVYPCDAKYDEDGEIYCSKKYYNFDHDDQWNMENRNFTILHDSEAQLPYCETEGVSCDDVVAMGDKGWVALDKNAQKKDMEDWISGAVLPPEIHAGFWLTSFAGVTNSDFQFLKAFEGNLFLVPIYNAECDKTQPSTYCPSLFLAGDNDDYTEGYGVGKPSYRIAGFGLFKLTCVHEKQEDACPYRALLGDEGFDDFVGNSKIKTIEGYFIEGTYPTGGGDGADAGVYTVHLRR
jgi:hypothetical protein